MSGFSMMKPPKPSKPVFYAIVDGLQAGPMTEAELKTLVKNGSVTADSLVWTPQMVQWTQARFVPAVNKLLLLARKPSAAQPQKESNMVEAEENPVKADLVSAITNLGFKNSEAVAAAESVLSANPGITLEDAVKESLKKLYR